MEKILKFQPQVRYVSANTSSYTFSLVNRDGHNVQFRMTSKGRRDGRLLSATSLYKADERGAYEEVMLWKDDKFYLVNARDAMKCKVPA